MTRDNFKALIIGFILLVVNKQIKSPGISYLAIFLIIVSLITTLYPLLNKRKKFSRAQLEHIDSMKGTEFEEYVAFLLKHNGYQKIKVTQQHGDQGIDIIARKNDVTLGIQCKRWKKNVGNKAVQEVYSGIGFYELDKAIVLTNSYYTQSAKVLAKQLKVELWSRTELVELLENYHRSQSNTSKR